MSRQPTPVKKTSKENQTTGRFWNNSKPALRSCANVAFNHFRHLSEAVGFSCLGPTAAVKAVKGCKMVQIFILQIISATVSVQTTWLIRGTSRNHTKPKIKPSKCQGAKSAKFVTWPSWSRFSWQIQRMLHPASQVALYLIQQFPISSFLSVLRAR